MKIREYQAGGAYSPYILHDAASPQAATTSKKTDKTEDKISGAIVDLLKQNGLRNDVDYTLAAANKFLADIDDPLSFGESNKYAKLIKLQSLVNRVKRNKESYDAAVKKIAEQNAGSEVALTSTGQMYVLDTEDESGTLKVITAKEYSENQDKYRALSNNELLEYREQASNLTFASSITNNLQSTIGMKSVMDYVNGLIGDFKEETSSKKRSLYTKKEQNQIEKGFETILSGSSPDGIYKVTSDQTRTNTGYNPEDKESYIAALNYLYRALPENMKNLLKSRTALEGLNPSKAGDVMSLLGQALQENTKHIISDDITHDYQADASKAAGLGASTEKTVELSREQQIFAGRTAPIQSTIINSSNDRGGLAVLAQSYGKPASKNGEQLGMCTIADLVKKDPLGHGIMSNSITFGDQQLSENDLRRVVYDGNSQYERVVLPYDEYVYQSTGKIVPDLNTYKKFEEFRKWKAEGNGVTRNAEMAKMQELGLSLEQDANGNWKPKNGHVFLVVNGWASDKALDLNTDSTWMVNMPRSEGSRIFDLYGRIINYGGPTKSKSTYRDDFSGGWFGIGDAGSMYKSAIFMPIMDTAIMTVNTGKEYASKEAVTDSYNYQQDLEASRMKTNW